MGGQSANAPVQDAPESLPQSVRALLENEWEDFSERVREEPGWQELASGPGWDTARLQKAVRITWELCASDAESLRKRLEEMNLNNLRQQQVLREKAEGRGRSETKGLEENRLVDYYEPLKYLSGVTRQLVIQILADKVDRIIEDGCNDALLKELAQAGAGGGGRLQGLLDKAEKRAERAEAQVKLLEGTVAQVQDDLVARDRELRKKTDEIKAAHLREQKLQDQINELAEDLAAARSRIKELEEENARLEREMAEFYEIRARLERELEEAKAELKRVTEELEKAKEHIAALQAQVAELESEIRALEERLRESEAKVRELEAKTAALEQRALAAEARAAKAETENEELRERLRCLENRRSSGMQTELIGSEVDRMKEETTQTKGMLEELRMKFRTLWKQLAKRITPKDLQDLVENCGLQHVLKAASCYERLYDDAMERIVRLERLQDEYAEKRRPDEPHKFAIREEMVRAMETSTLAQDIARAEEEQQQLPLLMRKLVQPPVFAPSLFHLGTGLPPLRPQPPPAPAFPWGFSGYQRPADVRRGATQLPALGPPQMPREAAPPRHWPSSHAASAAPPPMSAR